MKTAGFLNCYILRLAPFAMLFAETAPNAAAGSAPPAAANQTVGDHGSHTVAGNAVVFKCSGGATVRIELCQADVARIRMAMPGADFVPNEPYAVVNYDWPAVGATVADAGDSIKIATTEMVLRANKVQFHLGFYKRDNTTLIPRQGAYCTTEYEAVQHAGSVTIDIGARKAPGAYVPPPRHYLFKVHTGSDPGKVYLAGTALEKEPSEQALSASAGGWFYADGIAQIRFPDSGKQIRLGLGAAVPGRL